MKTITMCLLWFAGYSVMWVGKWILAFFFGHINLLQELSCKISERTSMVGYSEERITLRELFAKVLSVALNKPYVFLLFTLFIGYLVCMAYQRKKVTRRKSIILWIFYCIFCPMRSLHFCLLYGIAFLQITRIYIIGLPTGN